MDIKQYWNTQSEGYCEINHEELNSDIRDVWLRLIQTHLPKKKELVVLDVGCGPGFMAIILAQQGYKVTAIDFSEEMLKLAEKNAGLYCPGADIRFLAMDAQKLEFSNEEFDLVVSRNITWTLKKPEKAYSEWIRVLKTGGRMLNFDGNWRLHLHHPYLQALNEKAKDECIKKGMQVVSDGHDKKYAGDSLDNLPLADKIRPFWDVDCLTDIGGVKVSYSNALPDGIMNEYYTLLYKYVPMFMICVEKLG